MAIAIKFDKAKAERFIDSLNRGKSIEGVKTVDDFLALAGACYFMAMSQAPALQQAVDWKRIGRDPDDEDDEDTFFADLSAAIEYYGQLSMSVAQGEYDESFEPHHEAIVLVEDEEKTVIPVSGVRGDGEGDEDE